MSSEMVVSEYLQNIDDNCTVLMRNLDGVLALHVRFAHDGRLAIYESDIEEITRYLMKLLVARANQSARLED